MTNKMKETKLAQPELVTFYLYAKLSLQKAEN